MKDYIRRTVDDLIDYRMQSFDAILIVGPKGCGKTRTASERCKTIIEFQDEEKRDGYLLTVETSPSLLLMNEKPILFDEWQDAPKIWGVIRKACDDTDNVGEYFLTGSTSKNIHTAHTGTGRISTIEMTTMSLFESGESNGKVSLESLIEQSDCNINGCKSNLKIEDLIFATCRGGFPRAVLLDNKERSLDISKDYFNQICKRDISAIDNIKRSEKLTKTILWSYARNIATTIKTKQLIADVKANFDISEKSCYDYIDALERLYVIKDIDAWCPQIRSKTAIRGSKKRIFVEPSIAVAALGLGPKYFYNDFDLFGHVFENVVFRDLLSFSYKHNASVMHYRDDYGLEIDAIYQLENGDYALIEIKTGTSKIKEAESNLLKFKKLIEIYNENHEVKYRLPNAMIIISGTLDMAMTLESGVRVVPIGCLKD